MPGGDVGIEEPRSSAAAFLIPAGLIKRPRNVVPEIRIPCVSEKLKPRSRHREAAGITLIPDRAIFDLSTEDFGIPGVADGSPGRIVRGITVAGLSKEPKLEQEPVSNSDVEAVVDIHAEIRSRKPLFAFNDSQTLVIFFLRNKAFEIQIQIGRASCRE